MRLTRHFVLETPLHFSAEALERFRDRFTQWSVRGGVLVLPPESRMVDVGAPPPPPEGVSAEGAAWAEEEL